MLLFISLFYFDFFEQCQTKKKTSDAFSDIKDFKEKKVLVKMDTIPKNKILNYKSDTLVVLRSLYDLNSPARLEESMNLLEEWVQKQEHFEKKNFDRGYLERMLIYNKGSIEKCKKKLDKICTQRTLIPSFFAIYEFNKELIFSSFSDGLLSNMTPEYGRVHFLKIEGEKFYANQILDYYKYFVLVYKYIQLKDYCKHASIIVDWREANIIEFVKQMDISEFRKCMEIAYEGFSMRVGKMHVLTESKTIDLFLNIFKQFISEKLSKTIIIHKRVDSIYEYIPREILPQEYGGNEKSLSQLREDLFNELNSTEFIEYRREMNKACTNEDLRPSGKFNDEYLGTCGSFRSLTVD